MLDGPAGRGPFRAGLGLCSAITSVHIEQLSHTYAVRGRHPVPVLRDVWLEVDDAEHVALVGPSGSGKTTLLSVMGGLERPQSGIVNVCGHDLRRLDGDGLAKFRSREVGYVFQHFGLLEALTALENVELALTIAGRAPARKRRRHATALLERVGLGHRLDHRPSRLSGGERQRVAVARAIANSPRLLLADEPTGNLDDESAELVGNLLESLRREDGTALVIVTHHHALADRADRAYYLSGGSLVQPVRQERPETARPERPERQASRL